jgi:hypothetical protein
LFINDV